MPTDLKFAVEEFIQHPTMSTLRDVLEVAADESGIHPRFVDIAVAKLQDKQEEYIEERVEERADEQVEKEEKRWERKVDEAFGALGDEFRATKPLLKGEAAKELENFYWHVEAVFETYLGMLS